MFLSFNLFAGIYVFFASIYDVFFAGIYDALNIVHLAHIVYRSSRIRNYLYKTLFIYLFLILILVFASSFINLFSYSWIIFGYLTAHIFAIYHHFATKNLWISIFNNQNNIPGKFDVWYYVAEIIYGFIFSITFKVQNAILISIVDLFTGTLAGRVISMTCKIVSSSLIISWSTYEYKLLYMNKSLDKRIRNFEKRTLYFLGFGLPFALSYYYLSYYIHHYLWLSIIWLSINTISTIRIVESKAQTFQKTPKPPKPQKPPKTSNYVNLLFIAHYSSTVIINFLCEFFGKNVQKPPVSKK